MRRKTFSATLAEPAGPGTSRLVVATLGVIDRDGDVTVPGFFGRQSVMIIPAHDWTHVPLGKGTFYEQGDEALVDVLWNLDVPEARSWLAAVEFDLAHPPSLQQWSYGFTLLPHGSRQGTHDGRSVQFLQPGPSGAPGAKVHEVSPVLVGAGVNTRTLAVAGVPEDVRTIADRHRMAIAAEADREYARFVRNTQPAVSA